MKKENVGLGAGLVLLMLAASTVGLISTQIRGPSYFDEGPTIAPCEVYSLADYTLTIKKYSGGWVTCATQVPALPFIVETAQPWAAACGPNPFSSGKRGIIEIPVTQSGNVTDITQTVKIDGIFGYADVFLQNPQADNQEIFFVEVGGEDADVSVVPDGSPNVSDGCNSASPCTGVFGPYSESFVLSKEISGTWQVWINTIGGAYDWRYLTGMELTLCGATATPTPNLTATAAAQQTADANATGTAVWATRTAEAYTATPEFGTATAWISEVLPRPVPTGTPCVDWNQRGGCGADDSFVEIYSPGKSSLDSYRIDVTEGTTDTVECTYTFNEDARVYPLKITWLDFMNVAGICTEFPITGTVYLYDSNDVQLDERDYEQTTSGNSWAALNYATPEGTWAECTPSPGR